MVKFQIFCWTVILGSLQAHASDSLYHRWELEKQYPFVTVSQALRDQMKDTHVVFVTGSFNELSPGHFFDPTSSWRLYFGNNIASVTEDLHATAEVLNPSTLSGIKENASWFAARIKEISEEKKGKKVDVFAHSMGGGVALYAFLTDPEFRKRVHHLILVNASIGGAIDGAFYEEHQELFDLLPSLTRGVADQSPSNSAQLFSEACTLFRNGATTDPYSDASRRIFFVRASADNIVPLESQSHPAIGTVFDPLPVGHFDLVVWMLGASSTDQRAFTRAVFGAVNDNHFLVDE